MFLCTLKHFKSHKPIIVFTGCEGYIVLHQFSRIYKVELCMISAVWVYTHKSRKSWEAAAGNFLEALGNILWKR